MSNDQEKGWESNWEFDFWPKIPLKQRSNDIWLGHVIHHWKYLSNDYNTLPSHAPKRLYLKKIWMSKVSKHEKFQFWDFHLGVLWKNVIWM
jgi:hypothetical protein